MSKVKRMFATPKKAILACVCLVAILAALGVGTAFAANTITESSSIGAENAQNFAFADAGVDPTAAENVTVEVDHEQGQLVYEVEFTSDGTKYEYWIAASDGSVVKKETEVLVQAGSTETATAEITLAEAKAIALADAGLTESEVTYTEAKLELDDGVSVYDIGFYAENVEHEYEIDAATGAILSRSRETMKVSETSAEAADASVGADTETAQVTLETAKSTALADAGVSASDATFTKARLDTDDGQKVYDIEFYTASNEYEYEISATTGAILEKDVEARKTTSTGSSGTSTGTTSTSTQVTLETAKSTALADAGVSSSNATFTKAKLDTDDGQKVYDIEFYTASNEYDYEISATTGAILEKDVEARKTTSTGSSGTSTGTTSTSTQVTLETAKSTALADAGVSSSNATFTKAKLDTDDGQQVYDIEFYTTSNEYEYEISAITGAILEKSVEARKTTSTGSSSSYIGLDSAKSIAASQAGLSVSDVTFHKAKLDTDDGQAVYEIEFRKDGIEYECEIDANTGAVLEFDYERCC